MGMNKRQMVLARKGPSWHELGEMLGRWGWSLQERTRDKISYERGPDQIRIFKTKDGWKVEHFLNGRLVDSNGIVKTERMAKSLAMETGWFA